MNVKMLVTNTAWLARVSGHLTDIFACQKGLLEEDHISGPQITQLHGSSQIIISLFSIFSSFSILTHGFVSFDNPHAWTYGIVYHHRYAHIAVYIVC